jgi:hypothetical protein
VAYSFQAETKTSASLCKVLPGLTQQSFILPPTFLTILTLDTNLPPFSPSYLLCSLPPQGLHTCLVLLRNLPHPPQLLNFYSFFCSWSSIISLRTPFQTPD